MQNGSENQLLLSHRDPNLRWNVYTDALEFIWSGVDTQTSYDDSTKPYSSQNHQRLTSLSGHFTGSNLGWSKLEKEAYAKIATT